MDVGETLCVATRGEWRRWLAERRRGEARSNIWGTSRTPEMLDVSWLSS